MQVLDNFILSLGFCSQDIYLPRNRKGYESFHSMIDSTAIVLNWIFTQIQKRADMTSQWIRSVLSNCLSSPVRAKVKCCESHDLISCQVTDCSATRISSSRITSRHPQPTGSLVGGGVYPSAEVQLVYFTAPANWVTIWFWILYLMAYQPLWVI